MVDSEKYTGVAQTAGCSKCSISKAAEGEVRDAKSNERHACGRRRDGEAAVCLEDEAYSFLPAHPAPAETGSFPVFGTSSPRAVRERS